MPDANLRESVIPISPFSETYVAVETYNALAVERDRAVESRENANAATLRAEAERDRCRERVHQLELEVGLLRDGLERIVKADHMPYRDFKRFTVNVARKALRA